VVPRQVPVRVRRLVLGVQQRGRALAC